MEVCISSHNFENTSAFLILQILIPTLTYCILNTRDKTIKFKKAKSQIYSTGVIYEGTRKNFNYL